MYSYALSLNYRCAEDPKWFEAVSRSKVRKFEFGAENDAPPEAYAAAVDNILRTASTIGIEAASVHIPFGAAPWVPSRESERAIALEAIRGLMRAWAPLRPQRYTLHGCTEADTDVPHSEQMRALRVFLSEILPDVEAAGTSFNIEYLPRTCLGNTAAELLAILDGFGDEFGVCLDVNHLMGRIRELPDETRLLGDRLLSLHISDYDGVDECHFMPGTLNIDWPPFIKALSDIGYDGVFNYEMRLKGSPADRVRDTIANFKTLFVPLFERT